MFEAFLEDFRLLTIFILVCVIALWYNITQVINVLTKSDNGKTKHILITGCDSGFGYATALNLNESKCKVFVGCLTEEGVKKFQNDEGFKGIAFIMDVTKEEDIEKARKLIEDETKGIGLHVVINNAGIMRYGLIEWQSVEEMQKVMDINFWGAVRTVKAMLPYLKIAKGRIVNFSSIAGLISTPLHGVYPASKYAIEAFSDTLRNELKHWDVSVHIIEPAGYKTEITGLDFVKENWEKIWRRQSEETRNEFGNNFNIFVEKFTKILDENCSPNIHEVVDKVNHAVFSSNPNARYPVGKFSLLIRIISHLPAWLFDRLLPHIAPELKPDFSLKKKKNQ